MKGGGCLLLREAASWSRIRLEVRAQVTSSFLWLRTPPPFGLCLFRLSSPSSVVEGTDPGSRLCQNPQQDVLGKGQRTPMES